MKDVKRVLCPVDLSKNSLSAIEMATIIAKRHDATILFLYVSPPWYPEEAMYGAGYIREIDESAKQSLEEIQPADPSVKFEHQFVFGNPGAEIVSACKEADMVVMSSHGRRGLLRILMGSVAEYVLRHAKCPVILVKGLDIVEDASAQQENDNTFVTKVMHKAIPVNSFDNIENVLRDLKKAKETAAAVVDETDKCIGILTTTDIERYHNLQERFKNKDETVVKEMFSVNKYGQREPTNYDFDHVERHMTKDVVSVRTNESVQKAIELFEQHPDIHHLVVLDDADRAVGIVDVFDCVKSERSADESEKSADKSTTNQG